MSVFSLLHLAHAASNSRVLARSSSSPARSCSREARSCSSSSATVVALSPDCIALWVLADPGRPHLRSEPTDLLHGPDRTMGCDDYADQLDMGDAEGEEEGQDLGQKLSEGEETEDEGDIDDEEEDVRIAVGPAGIKCSAQRNQLRKFYLERGGQLNSLGVESIYGESGGGGSRPCMGCAKMLTRS